MTEPNLKLLFTEFMNINHDRKGVYEDQAQITFPKGEEDPLNLEIIITPKYGPFRNGRLVFAVTLPKNYPQSKPTVRCLTKVFHPNIKYVLFPPLPSFLGTLPYSHTPHTTHRVNIVNIS